MVRCKVTCTQNEAVVPGNDEAGFNIAFSPVYTGSKENEAFFKYTPYLNFQIATINAAAAKNLEVGKEYYVDISPAELAADSHGDAV